MQYGYVHQYGDQYTLVSSHNNALAVEGLSRLYVCPLFFSIFETTDTERRIALHHPIDPVTGKLDLYRHSVPHRETDGTGVLNDLLGKILYDIPDHAKYLSLGGWAQDGVVITSPKAIALMDSSLLALDDEGRLTLFVCFAIGPEHPQVTHCKGTQTSLYTLSTMETPNSKVVSALIHGFSVIVNVLEPHALKHGKFRYTYSLGNSKQPNVEKVEDIQVVHSELT